MRDYDRATSRLEAPRAPHRNGRHRRGVAHSPGVGSRRVENGDARRVWARVPVNLADWLDAEAARREVSASLIIVRALRHYRDDLPALPPDPSSPDGLDEWVANLNASP